ncbi:hypothetical protein [Clostridium prolinivorans]|uniref:hypothetical protein n=1 Tax=Clostridium prolinivorans TaxID=2769420 RepID=UPI000FD8703C|nr:hypothetical protein [Clostridium prolinivorans]
MMKITKGEALLYSIIFILALSNKVIGSVTDVELMYKSIVNSKIVTLVYIPMFLFILLQTFSERMIPELIIRYENIYNWSISNLKIIVMLSIRFCVIFNLITSIFMISCNKDLLFNRSFLIFIYISIIIQIFGWSLIGTLFLSVICAVNSIKLAYMLIIIFFLAIRLIMSPLSFLSIRNYIIPIWDTMFFYDLNKDYSIMIKYLFMNIAITATLFIIYNFLYKNRDIRIER